MLKEKLKVLNLVEMLLFLAQYYSGWGIVVWCPNISLLTIWRREAVQQQNHCGTQDARKLGEESPKSLSMEIFLLSLTFMIPPMIPSPLYQSLPVNILKHYTVKDLKYTISFYYIFGRCPMSSSLTFVSTNIIYI